MPEPPLLFAPNEHLTGTPEQRCALLAQFTALRANPCPDHMLPGLSFATLALLLDARPDFPNPDLLDTGLTAVIRRYRELGVIACLPPSRAWIATDAADPVAFGGFHYPGQGYRHWQMLAIITRYGPLRSTAAVPDAWLAALDLIRAYAHDSLHYASYRRYQLHPDGTRTARSAIWAGWRRPGARSRRRPATRSRSAPLCSRSTRTSPTSPGTSADRRPGQMYAGRRLCYEDTVAAVDAVFGVRSSARWPARSACCCPPPAG